MPTPQEIRNIRLKHDYKEMVNIQRMNNIISWKVIKGIAPHVEEYELTINIKTIISSSPNYRDQHLVKVTLPGDYPRKPPEVHMISSPQPFHPNWYKNSKWCYGTWNMSEGLGHHVIRMIRTLQYDKEITNENSPANTDANKWYMENKNSNLFPCDNQVLPDPTKGGFSTGGNKKFKIN